MKITKEDLCIDPRGYVRFKDSNKLLHRYIAKKEIYDKNRTKYPLDFSRYQIHHIDGNKQNNEPSNLKLQTVYEHEYEHGYERAEWPLIRALFIALIVVVIIPIWIGIANSNNLNMSIKIFGFITILILGYLTARFVNRKRKDIKEI